MQRLWLKTKSTRFARERCGFWPTPESRLRRFSSFQNSVTKPCTFDRRAWHGRYYQYALRIDMNAIRDTSLRAELPRLYELKDAAIDPSDPNEYFHRLEQRCAEHRTVFGIYKKLETDLSVLDEAAWADLRPRALVQATKRHPIRGWQALFDVFNKAKGFAYLRSIGCTDVPYGIGAPDGRPPEGRPFQDRQGSCRA